MTDAERKELFFAVEDFIAKRDEAEETPYIQAGDIEDVVIALEALGYKLIKE